MVANPLLVLTIATAGFYTAVRYGQQKFYRGLGLTPEDVGLDRVETLTRAAGLVFYVLVFSTIVVGLMVMLYAAVKWRETRAPALPGYVFLGPSWGWGPRHSRRRDRRIRQYVLGAGDVGRS